MSTPPGIRVTHLATTANDGAGIAMRRILAAQRAAGSDATLLLRECGPEGEAVGEPAPSWGERVGRRAPWLASMRQRWDRRCRSELDAAAAHGSWELFSPPFARSRPERHPAVRGADLLHLHWVAGFVDYPRFFGHVQTPIVWTLHDLYPALGGFHYEADRDANPRLQALEAACVAIKQRALAGHRLCVVGNSAWTTAAARRSAVFPAGTRFETVYYPLDATRFQPSPKATARAALGLDADAVVVGFACTGLDNPRKGFADLVAALEQLNASGGGARPVRLLSFGRDPDPAVRARLRSHWTHLGFLEGDADKGRAYAAMDCFVVPSRAEAFGQTAIEAMACGTAVIATDVGGLREALDLGRVGRLVPVGDVAAIAAAICQLADDPAARASFAELGRRHVMARHDPAACARRYQELYSELKQRGGD